MWERPALVISSLIAVALALGSSEVSQLCTLPKVIQLLLPFPQHRFPSSCVPIWLPNQRGILRFFQPPRSCFEVDKG
ncbi:hypothetical protein BYT27DRAFT_7196334 [Phlegmacium glaucopus]|nr:hypothetical protein BYT27DRAFT_7196334 [Phlegmacium glaucopus]